MDNRFIRAEEVAAELDVSKPYEIRKGRFGFKLTPPYSQERKQAASRLAKNNIENLRRTTK